MPPRIAWMCSYPEAAPRKTRRDRKPPKNSERVARRA
jgi:hypothetical protein